MDSTKVKKRIWRPLAIVSVVMLAATLLPLTFASAAAGSPPLNLVATAGPGAVTLAWDAPESDAASVTGYFIRRRLPDEGESRFTTISANTGSTDTTYTDLTANGDGTRYEYRVKALRNNGRSRRSNTAEAIGQAASEVVGTSLEQVEPPEPEPLISQQQEELDDFDDTDDSDVCARPSPLITNTDTRYEVKDFKIYVMGTNRLQAGDYLEWISPTRLGTVDNVESYTVELRERTGNNADHWTDLGTFCNQHGRHRYTITEDQPACTDWAIRVWPNFKNGTIGRNSSNQQYTSGPSRSKVSLSSAQQRPSSPNLTETHSGSLASQVLKVKWTRAECQSEYQVQTSRRSGVTHPPYDSEKDESTILSEGWTEWAVPSDVNGRDSKRKYTLWGESFDRMGDGVRVRVRVRNLTGWSNWSTHIWQRGFPSSSTGVTLITR